MSPRSPGISPQCTKKHRYALPSPGLLRGQRAEVTAHSRPYTQGCASKPQGQGPQTCFTSHPGKPVTASWYLGRNTELTDPREREGQISVDQSVPCLLFSLPFSLSLSSTFSPGLSPTPSFPSPPPPRAHLSTLACPCRQTSLPQRGHQSFLAPDGQPPSPQNSCSLWAPGSVPELPGL